MNPFRRLTTTLSAQFGTLIDQIENHEAVADSLIHQVERSAAKAKVQLRRVREDGARLSRRREELEQAKQQWTERALRIGETDRPRALACMKRLESVQAERQACEQQLSEQCKLDAQLARDLASIEENLAALRRKRNALASRQSRAEALQLLHADELGVLSEVQGLFTRWETKVTHYEVASAAGDGAVGADELESAFVEEEEQSRLAEGLDRLLREHKE